MGSATAPRPPEASVAGWWRASAFKSVATVQGKVFQVLYPGRPAPGSGPDFQDALLITGAGELVRGDVEVHVRQSDWRSHGHHLDHRYDRVALHLFLQGGDGATRMEGGAQIQEALLSSLSPAPPGAASNGAEALSAPPPSHLGGSNVAAAPLQGLKLLPPRELERALDEAGERRFLRKASAMLEGLRMGDAREALYAGLMEGLGYSRNRGAMLQLARRLPLGRLRKVVGRSADQPALEALLLGAAGLLPYQRGLLPRTPEAIERSAELTHVWRSVEEPLGDGSCAWDRAGLRPQNRPERRLVGASYLLDRYWSSGLEEGLRQVCESGTPQEIERGLEVSGEGFWAVHLDFHLPMARAPAPVGGSRARDMAVNVLLPFFHARAHLLGSGVLRRRTLDLYRGFPPGQDNEITREMRALLTASTGGCPVINSARRQQGLIHMYRILQGRVGRPRRPALREIDER